jgi:hypothetical protein
MTSLQIHKSTPIQRLWKVVRINLVRPWTALFLPLVIMSILASVIAILSAASIAFANDAEVWFSPEIFLIIFLFVVANQTIYHDFPLSLSYGISRRDFYLGSLLTFGLLAVWYAAISIAIATLTSAYFLVNVTGVGLIEFLGLVVAFMGTQVLSASITTIYLRWGKPGMLTFFGLLAITLIALPVLSLSDPNESAPRADSATIELLEGIAILGGFTLLAGIIGYLFIRRARVA